jgi:hypothetical protein
MAKNIGIMWQVNQESDVGATVEKPPIGDEPRSFNGSFVVAKATTREEVLDEIKKDVYAQRGIWNVDKVGTGRTLMRSLLTRPVTGANISREETLSRSLGNI